MFRFLQIHTVPPEEEGSTWLQLFFDLVYVAILVELGARLGHAEDFEEVIVYVLLIIPIWWSWLEFVDYGRRFPVDDIGQRILTLFYMAMMLLMAFEIHQLSRFTATSFIVTYGISKFILAMMYARSWIYYPAHRHLTINRSLSFVIVGVMWIAIAIIRPSNLWLWALAIILAAAVPLIVQSLLRQTDRAHLPDPPIKYHFMLHRFGELTIIVLGEFFIKLAISSTGRELVFLNYLMGAGLLGISVSIWWLYFDHLEHTDLAVPGTRLTTWTYSHLPFMAAITAYGVVGNITFAENPLQPLASNVAFFFAITLAVAVLSFGIIEWSSIEKEESLGRSPQPWIRLGSMAALLIIGLVGGSLNALWVVLLITLVLLFQVSFDVFTRLRRPDQEDARLLVER